ncbi:ankyrin repeat-containing domain protein [Apodospora peruviana]|uniref:Ankyrin repeat-containing domain protein n=1 Tax=Apodospora peruviana TaxID=516989 RepID=A0AAE0M3S0_9PEZI|nr:ankyrin repeat-containing domain protein [Apodospora peruviana]
MAPHEKPGKVKKLGPRSKSVGNDKKPEREKAPPPFLRLPPEIVLLIVELVDINDQLALNRTTQFHYSLINPIIYANNVKHGFSSSLFWGASRGRLGTVKHAFAIGADLNMLGPVYKKALGNSDSDNPPDDDNGTGAPQQPVVAVDGHAPATIKLAAGTPLHHAAKRGHRDVVEWLLNNGADIDAPSSNICGCRLFKAVGRNSDPARPSPTIPQWRPLHIALCNSAREVAELLIFRGAKLELEVTGGHTALHSAATRGLVPIIKLLALDVSFDINERDSFGNTALHYVSGLWRPRDSAVIRDTIAKLLALGADLEALNNSGHTPLFNACHKGNFAVAHRLVTIGANPDPQSRSDFPRSPIEPLFPEYRPLYFCTLPRSEFFDLDDAPVKHDEFEGNRVTLIRALVEAGADVDARFRARSHHDATALMLACELAEPRAVAEFIRCGAAVNAQDLLGRTPLYYACTVRINHRGEVPEIATILIQHKARMDLEDCCLSALDWAIKMVKWGENDVLETMLQVASQINLSHKKLKAALKTCASMGNHKALKPLLKFAERTYGVKNEDITEYIDLVIKRSEPWGQSDTFKCLMDFGKVNYSNEQLLWKTMKAHNTELSLAVLQRGVAVTGTRFFGGVTYLHMACEWGYMPVIEALLERAAEVDVFNDELRTPLMIAVAANDLEVVTALLTDVADPYLVPPDSLLGKLHKDKDERKYTKKRFLTAFDMAIRDSRGEILEEMLSRYTLPEIPAGTRSSYVHRACQVPDTGILKQLLKKGADANGGEGCLDPPVLKMLRYIWDDDEEDVWVRTPDDVRASCLDKIKLLFKYLPQPAGESKVNKKLKEIVLYDGPDEGKIAVRDMVRKELTTAVVIKGSGTFVNPKSKGVRISIG